MKKVLITGANSYIGTSFEEYMKQYEDYQIDTLDMKDANWKTYDFSQYDVVFHVAGLAHQKEKKENAHLYYEINRDLAIETAKKAKNSKVKQFVFMSSMSVYGVDFSEGLINEYTVTRPKTNYGKSKLEAEKIIKTFENDQFIVSIIRPPMVYGKNSPGNMTKLFNAVKRIHMFPAFNNERSSISIAKLCLSIKCIINEQKSKIYLPQNDQYMCTYEIVKNEMRDKGIKVIYFSLFNPIIKYLIGKNEVITKVFGDLKYEK